MACGTLRVIPTGSIKEPGVSFTATIHIPRKENRQIHTVAMLSSKNPNVVYICGCPGSQTGARQTSRDWPKKSPIQKHIAGNIIYKRKHLKTLQTE